MAVENNHLDLLRTVDQGCFPDFWSFSSSFSVSVLALLPMMPILLMVLVEPLVMIS